MEGGGKSRISPFAVGEPSYSCILNAPSTDEIPPHACFGKSPRPIWYVNVVGRSLKEFTPCLCRQKAPLLLLP